MTKETTDDQSRVDGVPEGAHGDLPRRGHGEKSS